MNENKRQKKKLNMTIVLMLIGFVPLLVSGIAIGIITAVTISSHLEEATYDLVGWWWTGDAGRDGGYLVIRYYKNLYSPQGYLTFTLPVKTESIPGTKVITGSVWLLLSYLSTFLALIIVGFGAISHMVGQGTYLLSHFYVRFAVLKLHLFVVTRDFPIFIFFRGSSP